MAGSRGVVERDRGSQRGLQQSGHSQQHQERQQSWLSDPYAQRLASGLGWFSIGLGLVEVLAPRRLADFLGIARRDSLLRIMGAREIATGIGILMQPRPAGWVWGRVAGDAVDLSLLGAAASSRGTRGGNLATAIASVAGVTALDVLCAQQLSQSDATAATSGLIEFRKSVTINASPEELYRFWRDFENLPRFMKHLESVEVVDQRLSHWVAKAPAGTSVEWDAEITDDQPNRRIAWRSLVDAAVQNRGFVEFEPATGQRGTVVRVEIQYRPPAGKLGALVAKLFGREPEQQVREDLRRFKRLMETGEVITTEGQPAGRSSSLSWKYDETV